MPIRKVVRRFFDLPLRRKLILSFLLVILLGGVLSLIIGTRIEHQTIMSLAEAKVRHDLAERAHFQFVRSEVGKGAVFTVRIPLADPGEEKRIEEEPQ